MKPLLIHHDNTPFEESFESSIKFDASNDIDNYISTTIMPEIQAKNPNIIFIKDNLSSNYLELYGLRLAYHLRFEERFKYVPIVILSDLDGFTLNRFEPMAKILFTKNVFLEANNKASFEKYNQQNIQPLTETEYKENFLSLVEIAPPENSSSHRISNEWAIYRWANALDVYSKAITENHNKISSMLYFKYLKALYGVNNDATESQEIEKLNRKGKVLYIDDAWDKGWGDILSTALIHEGLEFTVFEEKFRDKQSFDELKLNQINTMPDVVLLDLRLIAPDHKHDDIEDYSSMKILEKLHAFNPGIQVIMLTATGKSTILEKLYEKNILGYVKKEHPNDVSIDTVDNINKLIQLVDQGLDKKYLISIWKIQQTILKYQLFQDLDSNIESEQKLLELKNSISTIFDTLNSNIPNTFVFGMLELYKCIEIINDYYIYESHDEEAKKMKAYWKDRNELISNNGNKSVNNKIKNILVKLSLSKSAIDNIIDELSCSRNYQIHSNGNDRRCEGKIIDEPNELNIIEWYKMLQTIIEKIDKKIDK